jgi:hypothetical protein
LAVALELKFGADGVALLPELRQIDHRASSTSQMVGSSGTAGAAAEAAARADMGITFRRSQDADAAGNRSPASTLPHYSDRL